MTVQERIERFEKFGFGLFVHFGLFSVEGKGEWFLSRKQPISEYMPTYMKLMKEFKIKKNWAKELVSTAKAAGCKYITLTTRHHEGFSLFDTCGLNEFDAPHSAAGRDLIKEFADECHKQGIMPFFYHTLMDWWHPDYKTNFPAYIDYLVKSIEILCKNYGEVGGFWFDGMWDKPNDDWQEDRIYSTIRKYQPDAMIINNTGLDACGRVGHPEIDSVTFERGKPTFVDNSDRPRAGEMCQVLNDHWGYAKEDYNYKSVKELVENLVDCRRFNCNFLLNTGLRGDGSVSPMDKGILENIGAWIKDNDNFIYDVKSCDVAAENAIILQGKDCRYAVIKGVPMSADPNVQRVLASKRVKIDADVKKAVWLDNGAEIDVQNGEFNVTPFFYGTSKMVRIAKF